VKPAYGLILAMSIRWLICQESQSARVSLFSRFWRGRHPSDFAGSDLAQRYNDVPVI
jgi:hypothetical protein